jgi:ATP-dependent Clp protease ATP-binding subunit ClpA
VPHINVDAASQPDYHTASAQLLGSGRGIVGSYEAGRLEKAAKHADGAVVEISDLDHAPISVRGHLADLFLQVLDTGEAQSATGATFSCANLIFAFTINLPDGQDERIHRGIGFDSSRSRNDVQARVEAEIKKLFSNAFLSRIGRPILFAPLGGSELALVAEREIARAINQGLDTLKTSVKSIQLADGLGSQIISSIEDALLSHGARVVAEHARGLATQALLQLHHVGHDLSDSVIVVRSDSDTGIVIDVHKE